MTEIVVVRHGETVMNTSGVFRGRSDVGLNERGVGQARALGRALREPKIDAFYSCPMSRALSTAEEVAKRHGLTPLVDEAFNNIDLGEWQGTEKAAVERDYPDLWRLWTQDPDALVIPGGETLASVRERAYRRTLELVKSHEGRRIAIVSHRSVAKLLAGALLGMDSGYFWSFYLDNAGFSVFGHRGERFVLLKWNESCHLEERTVEHY